jgi:hypothetical protein
MPSLYQDQRWPSIHTPNVMHDKHIFTHITKIIQQVFEVLIHVHEVFVDV